MCRRDRLRNGLWEIGPPVALCPYCKRSFNTGGTEWADMTLSQRLARWGEAYAYHALLLGPILSFLIAYGLTKIGVPWGWFFPMAGALYLGILWLAHSDHRDKVKASLSRKPTRESPAPPPEPVPSD